MLYMYCSQAALYGELQFAHTFSQKITKFVHKLTPSIASDLALEIILNSEKKYNKSE